MEGQVEQITVSQVATLVERIFDDAREHPLVLVSCASDTERPRVSPAQIAEQNPTVDVVLLESMSASNRLSDHVGASFRAFGGAVRVIWPGARPSDAWRRHGLFLTLPDDDPDNTLARIRLYLATPIRRPVEATSPRPRPPVAGATPATLARKLSAPAGASPAEPAQHQPFSPASHPAPAAPQPVSFQPQPEIRQPTPASPVSPSSGETRLDLEALSARLDKLERHVNDLPGRIEKAVGRRVSEVLEALLGPSGSDADRERAEAAEAALQEAREHNQQLEQQLEQRYDDWLPTVYDDPEHQLRYEIEQTWLMLTSSSERAPLRPYRIAQSFLDDLVDPPVERSKAVRCIVDILTGPADTGRIHPWKAGKAAANVRRDGAMMWRYHVQRNSPQAARLMYWDGGPELELVRLARHDDHRGLP